MLAFGSLTGWHVVTLPAMQAAWHPTLATKTNTWRGWGTRTHAGRHVATLPAMQATWHPTLATKTNTWRPDPEGAPAPRWGTRAQERDARTGSALGRQWWLGRVRRVRRLGRPAELGRGHNLPLRKGQDVDQNQVAQG